MQAKSPLISVIVPVYNSSRMLSQCLQSVRSQSHGNIELIVVDSHSKDATVAIAQEYGAQVFQVDGVPNTKRVFGMRHARGEYILLLDSDMVLSHQAMAQCLNKIATSNLDALALPDESVTTGYWSRCLALSRGAYLDSGIYPPNFFPKAALDKVTFDEETFFGDDYLFHVQMKEAGYKIGVLDGMIKHYETTKLSNIVRRYYEASKEVPAFAKKHGMKHTLATRTPSITSFFKRWVFTGRFLRDPHHFAGIVTIKWLRFWATIAGIAAGSLGRGFHSH